MNVLQPTKELTMNLPWRITRETAVLALITGRTFDQQLAYQLEDGMRIMEQRRAK